MLPVEGHADLKGAEAHEERQESGLVQLKKRSYCYLQLLNGKEKKKQPTNNTKPDSSQVCAGQETEGKPRQGKNPITYKESFSLWKKSNTAKAAKRLWHFEHV